MFFNPAFCKNLLIISPTLVKNPWLNFISPVCIAPENKVKTSSIFTDSGSALYCSNLAANSVFSIPSILNNSVFNSLPKFIAVPLLFFNVLNNKACRNSWFATSTARSLADCSLFITIVCSPVSLFCNIKPCCPNAFLSTLSNLGSLDNVSASLAFSTVKTVKPSTPLDKSVIVSVDIANWFSALICPNLFSISTNFFFCVSTKALLSPAFFISALSKELSSNNCTVSFNKGPCIFRFLAILTAPWVDLKFIFISLACSIVKSPDDTFCFNSNSNFLLANLFSANLILSSVISVPSKASNIELYWLSSILLRIELFAWASLIIIPAVPVPLIPPPVAAPIIKVSASSNQ